jgi:hypothetical protein
LGGIVVSPPEAVAWGPDRLDVFALGTDHALWHRWWDGAAWGGWESLSGALTSPPEAVSWGQDRLDVFALGTDHALWHRWWDGTSWGGWESLGGVLTSPPVAVSWASDRLDVFALGTDHALWHRWWDGAAWGGWESLGGTLTSAPTAVSWAKDRLDVFGIGTDNAVWHTWWDGTAWGTWESLGGSVFSEVAAVSWAPDRLDLFALGTDNAVWHRWWDGAAWGGWESLGGSLFSELRAVARRPDRLDVFATGTDNAVWRQWWDGTQWRGWEPLGGSVYSPTAVASWGPDRLDVFAIGTDSALWHNWSAQADGRVRRNVAKVSQSERDKLRDAILALDAKFHADGVSLWDKQDAVHQATHVHRGPAFLPWHRELVNRFEAQLQQIDPTVALHYWDWTTDPRAGSNGAGGTTDLFTSMFMGSAAGRMGAPFGSFDNGGVHAGSRNQTGNPADPPQEVTRGVASGAPAIAGDVTITTTGDSLPEADQYPAFRGALERAHDTVHGFIGGNIGFGHTAFEDPFVFLLHSNVDRLFALWQRAPGRDWRLDPARVYGSEGSSLVITQNMEPWAGASGLRPWAPPDNQQVAKNAKHPSIVEPPVYD